MKTSAASLVVASSFLVSSATGFLMLPDPGKDPGFGVLKAKEASYEDDFDAPTDRVANAGNMVASPPSQKIFGVLEVPRFLTDAFQGKGGKADEPNFIADDECYLGKNDNMDECADFDPPHSP